MTGWFKRSKNTGNPCTPHFSNFWRTNYCFFYSLNTISLIQWYQHGSWLLRLTTPLPILGTLQKKNSLLVSRYSHWYQKTKGLKYPSKIDLVTTPDTWTRTQMYPVSGWPPATLGGSMHVTCRGCRRFRGSYFSNDRNARKNREPKEIFEGFLDYTDYTLDSAYLLIPSLQYKTVPFHGPKYL